MIFSVFLIFTIAYSGTGQKDEIYSSFLIPIAELLTVSHKGTSPVRDAMPICLSLNPHSGAANLTLNLTPALTSTRSTYINGDAIIQAFANHSLSLNVDIFPVFNRQHLHQFAVYVE